MNWLVFAVLGIGATVMTLSGSIFYARALASKRNALFLSRVSRSENPAESELLARRAQRLSTSKRMQNLLRDFPFVAELVELLEASGAPTTVARLLLQMVLTAAIVAASTRFLHINLQASVFAGLFSFFVPVLYVRHLRTLRAAKFQAQLPQVLELIALYLRAGRSLPQAFVGATQEILPPASEEFFAAAEEYRLGRPLDVSLKLLAKRYPRSVGFRLFAIAVSVLAQTGGNLVEVIERIKKTLEAGVTYGLKLQALTAESRLSAWILGVLPGFFVIILAILNPGYFNIIFRDSLGHVLLATFLGLWLSGIVWIRLLMNSNAV